MNILSQWTKKGFYIYDFGPHWVWVPIKEKKTHISWKYPFKLHLTWKEKPETEEEEEEEGGVFLD